MDGKWVQFFPSGRRYRVVGGLEDKSEDIYNPTRDGIYVDVYYNEDDINSGYFLRVESVPQDDEGTHWEKYYEIGDHGLVEVENLHRDGEDAEADDGDVEA